MPRLISVHFPKAGGTSMGRALLRALSPENMLFDYDDDDPANPDCLKWIAPRDFDSKKPEQIRALCVHGHFCPDKYDRVAGARVVMLRHPVDTIFSVYYFWLHMAETEYVGHRLFQQFKAERPPILRFIEIPALRHLMSRTYFHGYDMAKFSAIGDYANREPYLAWIEALMGIHLDREIFINVTPPSRERRLCESDERLLGQMTKVLADDIAFYERWSSTFHDVPDHGRSFHPAC